MCTLLQVFKRAVIYSWGVVYLYCKASKNNDMHIIFHFQLKIDTESVHVSSL